jgi:hypothetical protein
MLSYLPRNPVTKYTEFSSEYQPIVIGLFNQDFTMGFMVLLGKFLEEKKH